jgi:hypothetical protein
MVAGCRRRVAQDQRDRSRLQGRAADRADLLGHVRPDRPPTGATVAGRRFLFRLAFAADLTRSNSKKRTKQIDYQRRVWDDMPRPVGGRSVRSVTCSVHGNGAEQGRTDIERQTRARTLASAYYDRAQP